MFPATVIWEKDGYDQFSKNWKGFFNALSATTRVKSYVFQLFYPLIEENNCYLRDTKPPLMELRETQYTHRWLNGKRKKSQK